MSFLEQLAEHLGTDKETARGALDEWVRHTREQLRTEGTAAVPGLGTFHQIDGALVFESDERFALAVNLRYAGLEPLNVQVARAEVRQAADTFTPAPAPPPPEELPEFPAQAAAPDAAEDHEPAAGEPDEVPDGEVPAEPGPTGGVEIYHTDEDEWVTAARPKTTDEELPLPEDEEKQPPAEAEEAAALSAAAPPPEAERVHLTPPEAPEEPAVPMATDPFLAEGMHPEVDEPETGEEAPAETAAPLFSEPPPEEEELEEERLQRDRTAEPSEARRSRVPLIAAGLLILAAAGAAAFFLLRSERAPLDPSPPLTEQVEPPLVTETLPGESPDAAAAQEETTPDPGPTQEEPAAAETQPGQPAETVPPASPFENPLRGSGGISPAAGGFSLIVSSSTDRQVPETVLTPYRDEGYRVGILTERTGGVTRYRAAVGQFETAEQAVAARDRLAGELPEDAWVLRIQPDM